MDECIKKIVLALDVEEKSKAISLVKDLKDYVGMFKIGKQLFTRYGPDIVKEVISLGGEVFLDLKFHDIPNTVAKAAREATRLGVKMFNVHAVGGESMMTQTINEAENAAKDFNVPCPIILGVTVLTSITPDVLQNEINCLKSLPDQVVHLAKLAKNSRLSGVVASPEEISLIRKSLGEDFVILTPGIRPSWSNKNDQKRIMTPSEAISKGADYIVIGRPILHAGDPKEAAKKIIKEIETNI